MYAPNQYYQPYTADSEGRSRRHSTSSVISNHNNNNNNSNKARHGIPGSEEAEAGGRGLCSLRCCCVGLALVLVIGGSAAGVTSWVLTRERLSPGTDVSVSHTYRDYKPVNSDNLSDISPLLQSESDKFILDIDNSVKPRINKESEFSTTTRQPSSPRTTKTTTLTSHSTTSERITTYSPQYTRIISKMKEMRKQRLSNKYFTADELRFEDEGDHTTEAMKGTTTTTTTATTKSPTSTYASSDSVENYVESSTSASDISVETTTTEIKSPEELLKSSKFLRFQEEVLFNYTRSERNHKNNSTKDEPNQIIEATDGKQVTSKNLDLSPKLLTSTPLTPLPSVTSSVRDEVTSSEKSFYAYPAIVTYTIDESTETQGKISHQKGLCTCMMAAKIAALYEW